MYDITGNNLFSTTGRKFATINLNLLKCLSGFGVTKFIIGADMLLSEKYLVPVWNDFRGTTLAETFEKNINGKSAKLQSLQWCHSKNFHQHESSSRNT